MYVIYHKDTTVYLRYLKKGYGWRNAEYFKTEAAAKAFLTRAANGKVKLHEPIDKDDYAIADRHDFIDNIEKSVTKKNLMSGKDVTMRVNTPLCCDPSSETYWSM
jgi:hypothetical protein